MEFRDLGPLLVDSDGLSQPPGGARLSTLVAVLLVSAGEPVSPATLIDAIWGVDPPARSSKVLESHIWRLRKVLEPTREPGAAPVVLLTAPAGYRLVVPPEHIDSKILEKAALSARKMVAEKTIDGALALTQDALSRWRGPYCADVPDTGWLAPVRARLLDIRLDLVELRAQALIAAGRPEQAVHELAVVIVEHPLRERLWEQRILGLYQSGRQGAALDAFDQVRRLLGDELGVDPGPELAALHHQILNHDKQLMRVHNTTTARATIEVRLPSRRSSIVGRGADEQALSELLEGARLVTITGAGGVGKTRLAVEVAYSVRGRFPGGVWFVDLAPMSQPDSVAAVVANTLGLQPAPDTPTVQLITQYVASRQLLLVFDNCEHLLADVADVVDAILEASDQTKVLVTSREPLDVIGERRYPLAPLPVPDRDDSSAAISDYAAVELLLRRMDDHGVDRDLRGRDNSAITRICAAVGGLPLGIELAAARARTFELEEIADSLDGAPGHLSRSGPGQQRHANLLETVDWGYRLAGHDEQLLHRRLAVMDGAFTLEAAARLCALAPLEEAQALDLVGGLVHRSLLVSVVPVSRGRKSTFFQLVPIRAHAAHALTEHERCQALEARNRWVIGHIAAAPLPGAGEQSAHYEWLEDNQAAVRGVLRSMLVGNADVSVLTLLWRLIFFWHDREQIVEFLRWAEVAESTFAGVDLSDFDLAVMQAISGCAQAFGHNTAAAEKLLSQAIPVLVEAPRDRVEEAMRLLLVVSVCAWTGDVFEWSGAAATAVIELSSITEDRHTVLGARGILAANALVGGDVTAAVAAANSVLAEHDAVGNNLAALFANVTHSIAAKFAGDGKVGLTYCDAALRSQKLLGTHNFSESFETRGSHLANDGQVGEAARYFGLSYALSLRQRREWPWHPGTESQLASVRAQLSGQFETHWNSGVRMAQVDPVELVADL